MTDEQKQLTEPAETPVEAAKIPISATVVVSASAQDAGEFRERGKAPGRDGRRFGRGSGPLSRRGRGVPKPGDVPAEADYEEKNIEIARVTRVTKGGKRMRFRALSVIGNRKGRVGFGLAKGMDVALSTNKAMTQARKGLITVPLVSETIPHQVEAKFGASRVLLKPAPKGTGIKAGGAVRVVLGLAGVPNVVSKILGSSNKINNVKATFLALKKLRVPVAKVAGDAEDVPSHL